MTQQMSRRAWLKTVSAASVSPLLIPEPRVAPAARVPSAPPQPAPTGTILPLTSTSEVFVPPRGRSFMKFSFDFPEPSVQVGPLRVGFLVFTHENAYGLDASRMTVASDGGALTLACSGFVWAGGQAKAPGRLEARFEQTGQDVEWHATVEMDRPIKAVTAILRGVPRGRISAGGSGFFDPRDGEQLFGYPFSGGDLFGPGFERRPDDAARDGGSG